MPKLRFPGFEGEYEVYPIGELFAERSERGHGSEELLSVTINDGVKRRSEIDGKDNSSKDKSSYKMVYKGDMVYNSMRMWQGASGVSDFQGIVSPAYTVLKPNVNIDMGYIAMYFKTSKLVNKFRKNSQGMTSDTWNLKYEQISPIRIKMPSLEEQSCVSCFFRCLNQRIEKQHQLIESLKSYKRGLLYIYFVTNKWNTHSSWNNCKLGILCSKIGGGKTPSGGAMVYVDTGIMFLRSQNVLWGVLDTTNISYINETINNTMLSSKVQHGDILLNITGASIGRSCIYSLNHRANVNQHVCIIRLSKDGLKKILPEFLLQQILSDRIQQQIMDNQNGGSREGLNFQQINNFDIVIPGTKEQEKMCTIFSIIDTKILVAENIYQALVKQRIALLQQLFI